MSRITDRLGALGSVRYGPALFLIFGIGLFLRTYYPYDNVFGSGYVRFQINDPWVHMRSVENLAHNFPHLISFDPYMYFPHGLVPNTAPLYDFLLGFCIWIIGLGSPSEQVIETVGAYFPAILGALVTVPVYFIGRELFNRKVGLLAAALVAILPGNFLLYSLMGFTDHHVAEVLLSTTAMMFLILALRSSRSRDLSFDDVRHRNWTNLKRPFIYSLLCGVFLACYLTSWIGGGAFIFIIFVFAAVQYLLDHLRGRSTDYLCIVGVPALLVALVALVIARLVFGGYALWDLQVVALVVGIAAFVVLSGLSNLMVRRRIRAALYPLILAALAGIGVAIFYAVDPDLLRAILNKAAVFKPTGAELTISEVIGLPISSAWDTSASGWLQFTTGLLLSLVSLAVLTYVVFVRRKGEADKTLFLVWSVVMLFATLGQSRFAYYFAVNVGLLTAYLSWRILEAERLLILGLGSVAVIGTLVQGPFVADGGLHYDDFRYFFLIDVVVLAAYLLWKVIGTGSLEGLDAETRVPEYETASVLQTETQAKEVVRGRKGGSRGKKRRKTPKESGIARYVASRYVWAPMAIVAVFLLAFYPSMVPAIRAYAEIPSGADPDWHSSLVWMRENTPEPFQDPDFYYDRYERPAEGQSHLYYPESAYGVMSWWDYGYWIARISHRIPNAIPGQAGAREAGLFLTAQDESSGNEVLDELGSKYVIIDYQMPTSKFYAMVDWAEKDQDQFFGSYYQVDESGRVVPDPIILYHSAYYRSMCARLYNFGGRSWDPYEDWIEVAPDNRIKVISYVERTTADGIAYKIVSDAKEFTTYDEAMAWVNDNPGYLIVGTSPLLSPVPLEELEHHKLVYRSPTTAATRGGEVFSRVHIFEYVP